MTAETFRTAYGTLQKNAELLRTQREPDLDNLLEVVTQSVAAYKVCKSRIDAVEQALEQALSSAGLGETESSGTRPSERQSAPPPAAQQANGGTPTDFSGMDDNIKF
jgi:exodeoxyribonuclease VII small subunit